MPDLQTLEPSPDRIPPQHFMGSSRLCDHLLLHGCEHRFVLERRGVPHAAWALGRLSGVGMSSLPAADRLVR